MINGIDISYWQGKVDWSKVKADFVILRSSHGFTKDVKFDEYRKAAHARGFALGYYHFADGYDPVKEADFFLQCVGDILPGEVLALDFEIHYSDPVGYCEKFVKRIIDKVGFTPLFYSYVSIVNLFKKGPVLDCGLWVADPSQSPPRTGSWKTWACHQYTVAGAGKTPGFTTTVDLDHFNGSVETFKKYGKPGSSTPSPEPIPPTPTPVPTPGVKVVLPLDKIVVTQEFGERPEYYKKYGLAGHNGIDFRTRFIDSPLGKRYINAVMDGVVSEIANEGSAGYGLYVRLRHRGDEETIYGHLKMAYVKKGEKVSAGTLIALSDNSGASSGAHLHLGWRPENYNLNNGFKGYENPRKLFGNLLS